jgi:hypothetical protein
LRYLKFLGNILDSVEFWKFLTCNVQAMAKDKKSISKLLSRRKSYGSTVSASQGQRFVQGTLVEGEGLVQLTSSLRQVVL